METNIQISELLKQANPLGKIVGELAKDIEKGGGSELKALAGKIEHMALDIGSPSSIIPMLTRIVTKGLKNQKKPGGYRYEGVKGEPGEPYGRGHFRWDWKARVLNDRELGHLRKVLKQIGINNTTEGDDKYNQVAKQFLQKTKTEYSSRYYAHDKYFDGDKDTRDIYTITLKNSEAIWEFKFGQSINNTGSHPTEYDVLACIIKYDPGDYEEFCSEYGYEEDSRSAYKTYQAVCEEWKQVQKLFTEKEIEELQEIQ